MTQEDLQKSEETAWLLKILKDQMGLRGASLASHLENDLGMDSMDFSELIVEIEEKYHVKIDGERLDKIRNVQDVVNLMIALRPPPA